MDLYDGIFFLGRDFQTRLRYWNFGKSLKKYVVQWNVSEDLKKAARQWDTSSVRNYKIPVALCVDSIFTNFFEKEFDLATDNKKMKVFCRMK